MKKLIVMRFPEPKKLHRNDIYRYISKGRKKKGSDGQQYPA